MVERKAEQEGKRNKKESGTRRKAEQEGIRNKKENAPQIKFTEPKWIQKKCVRTHYILERKVICPIFDTISIRL